MSATISTAEAVLDRVSRPDYQRWLGHVASAGGCVRPVQLTGQVNTVDITTGRIIATRETRDMADGVIYVPCGDRRASVCPWCAEVYRADTYQLIRAGLVGGKGIPETVAAHPAVFATLTAPSFGPVHTRVVDKRTGRVKPCRPRRKLPVCRHGRAMFCTERHTEGAACLGQPLCLSCYDYPAHVVWNAWVGELWRYTTIRLGRLAAALGREHGTRLRVSFGKVAEYQTRGVVHFHALIRLDALHPHDRHAVLAPPPGITAAHLAELVAQAVAGTRSVTPVYPGTDTAWELTWGAQLDLRPITRRGSGEITSEAVAGYLAKYATKSTEAVGLVSKRLTAATIDHHADPDSHVGRLVGICWELGTPPESVQSTQDYQRWHHTYGRLARWAHMLGFGGHFATKSRRYSTTHTALRAARTAFRRARYFRRINQRSAERLDADTTLIVGALSFAGIGWHNSGDALLATSAAARAREHRRLAKQERTTTP